VVDRLLTEGEPEETDADELRRQIQNLEQDLEDARAATKRAREQSAGAVRALTNLRKMLEQPYRAMRAVFGELEAAGIASPASPESPGQGNPKWESWKKRMPGKTAEFIDLLLTHEWMTAAQLKAAAHCSSDTVYQTIYKLNTAGLIRKDGGRFSLKDL